MPAIPPITLSVGDRDITASHDGLTFSNVDPGGYETLAANPRALQGIRPGALVVARCGLETVFHGRLNEPDQRQSGQHDSFSLAALGAGDLLKRGRIQEIWIDCDLSRWASPGVARQIAAPSLMGRGPSVVPDQNGPALATGFNDPWTQAIDCDAWYNGGGIDLDALYYAWKLNGNINAVSANWAWDAALSSDDVASSTDATASLRAAGPGSGTISATTAGRKFAFVQAAFSTAFTGTSSLRYDVLWTCLAVYGRHGLTKRGVASASAAQGFYPDDIAWDAVRRAGGIARGRVDQASGYIVPHYTQLTPVAHEKVTLDMAQLMGWHTGVWEPLTLFGTDPAWYFHPVPDTPTCSVSRYECEEADLPKVRLDQLFDTAKVAWRDSAGTSGVQTVTLTNPYLQEAGISGQVLDLDLGIGSAAAATAYGTFALRLAVAAARGSGYVILPQWVRDANGGLRPSCTLKAGRDRIRIRDLPDPGPIDAVDTRRYDSFRVRRVETTVQNGIARTRAEFDGGGDLMEVLNARSAQARVLTGTG